MSNLSAHDKAVLETVFNPNLPLGDFVANWEPEDEEDETPDILWSKQMELNAIETAEKGNLQEGLDVLNRAIQITHDRPSLYNNRAYIFQFLRQFQDAFNDLTTAIDLCTEKHKKTLCQAYCQRAILHKRADRKELAKADFEKAAELGSKFAKSQLVELNPYAALCNQMLRQVMDKLK
ncbi:tetratricopeptide repeat protein 36 homolog [Euwallacea similis]|uniref:tetratricopeptide repeat protein 36 homolog n=1 Tax=Euwallacea similis TaxID=1736056 RepID=UPI00344F4B35